MTIADDLKRLYRTHVHAGPRYSPDVQPKHRETNIAASRIGGGDVPVIMTCSTRYAPLGAANYVGAALSDRPAIFLVWLTWSLRPSRRLSWLTTAVSVYRDRRPRHRILILCNEPQERAALIEAGIDAVHFNHNALTEEDVFAPVPGTQRTVDAVYNAAMIEWKRRELARLVPTCAHIFYETSELGHARTLAYIAELRALMPRHDFVNRVVDGRIAFIGRAEVNAILSRCRAGLCLSAEEGAMFASMEYLLAGLPVVSTPAIGGRDVFADPEYWLTVPATAEAVRDGVAEVIARNIPPERVRARTLERIYEHRARLRETVSAVTGGAVVLPPDFGDPIYRRTPWIPGDTLMAALRLLPD